MAKVQVVFVISLGEAFVRQLGVNNLLGRDGGDWFVHSGGALLLVVVLGGKKFLQKLYVEIIWRIVWS